MYDPLKGSIVFNMHYLDQSIQTMSSIFFSKVILFAIGHYLWVPIITEVALLTSSLSSNWIFSWTPEPDQSIQLVWIKKVT